MRFLIRVASLVGFLLFASTAWGQLQGPETGSTGIVARMHDPGVTPNTMVDGQNNGDNVTGNSFVTMAQGIALAKEQERAAADLRDIAAVARRYRDAKAKEHASN